MRLLLVATMSIVFVHAAFAQDVEHCGEPPPVANEELRGEIKGEAQFLSRFLGNAALSGNIQKSRTEVFSKYGDAELSRSNAYFEYQVCVLLMGDKTLTNRQKLNELIKIKREFKQPVQLRKGDNTLEEVDVMADIEKIMREASPGVPEETLQEALKYTKIANFVDRVAEEGRVGRTYKKTIDGIEYRVAVRTEYHDDSGRVCRMLVESNSEGASIRSDLCKYAPGRWVPIERIR